MPKLYGAPAYARPPRCQSPQWTVLSIPTTCRSRASGLHEDPEPVVQLEPRVYEADAAADPAPAAGEGSTGLQARSFRLRIPGRSPNGR